MDTLEKAGILSKAGKFDSCGPKMCEVNLGMGIGGIYHAKAEHKTCRIFKTLMDSSCIMDCRYCQNSSKSCKKRKASFKPEELASLFNHLNKKLAVDGLFLSSGVASDPDKATEKMIEAVRILRMKYSFKGYIHFKVLPGASKELVKQASFLSDRMSINIEAPNSSVMRELSSTKDFRIDILRRQAWIRNLKNNQSTQLILTGNSTDYDILKMAKWQYDEIKLKRMYYSSFRPVHGTPLENEKAEPLQRQNHLYNVDFLVRCYNYSFSEFRKIMNDGMLPKSEDPKLSLAKACFECHVDINDAGYEELIRIPGIGPVSAERIISSKGKITKFEHLKNFGASVERAKPFISICGKKQMPLSSFA